MAIDPEDLPWFNFEGEIKTEFDRPADQTRFAISLLQSEEYKRTAVLKMDDDDCLTIHLLFTIATEERLKTVVDELAKLVRKYHGAPSGHIVVVKAGANGVIPTIYRIKVGRYINTIHTGEITYN